MSNNLKVKIEICFLIIIELVFCFTPLGAIPIGPIVATLMMVPVIVTSIMYGIRYGILLGFVAAMCSFIYWTFIMPAFPTAFLFTPFSEFAGFKGNFGSLIICFVPRVFAGISPSLVMMHKKNNIDAKNIYLKMIFASLVGSFTNTVLVLLFIFIFFKNQYELVVGKTLFIILTSTIFTNGIPECIITVIVCPIISNLLKKING